MDTATLSDPFSNANEPRDIFRRALECTSSREIIIIVLIHASILAKCTIRRSHKCEEGEVPKEGCPNNPTLGPTDDCCVLFYKRHHSKNCCMLYATITPYPSPNMPFYQPNLFKSFWNYCGCVSSITAMISPRVATIISLRTMLRRPLFCCNTSYTPHPIKIRFATPPR